MKMDNIQDKCKNMYAAYTEEGKGHFPKEIFNVNLDAVL